MDIKEIKAIVDLMKRSGLTEFQLEEEGFKLKVCRRSDEVQTYFQPTPAPFPMAPASPQSPASPPDAGSGPAEGPTITSPMVGTFYAAPSPGSPPFVNPGSKVTPETVVCILEAMKVMNEIKAETTGEIVEVLVENGDSVEYGQPLFRLR